MYLQTQSLCCFSPTINWPKNSINMPQIGFYYNLSLCCNSSLLHQWSFPGSVIRLKWNWGLNYISLAASLQDRFLSRGNLCTTIFLLKANLQRDYPPTLNTIMFNRFSAYFQNQEHKTQSNKYFPSIYPDWNKLMPSVYVHVLWN